MIGILRGTELLKVIESPSSWFLADNTYVTTLIVRNVHNDRRSARLQDMPRRLPDHCERGLQF